MSGDLDEDLAEWDGIGREGFRSGRAGGGGEGCDGTVELDLGVEFRIIRVRFKVGLFQAPSTYRQANPQRPQHIPRSYPLPPPSRYSDPGRKGWVYGIPVDPARDVTGGRSEGDRIQGAVEELVSPAPGFVLVSHPAVRIVPIFEGLIHDCSTTRARPLIYRFGRVPFSSITLSDAQNWLSWSCCGLSYAQVQQDAEKSRLIETGVQLLQARTGWKFPISGNDSVGEKRGLAEKVKLMRLTMDPVRVFPRPLWWYAALWIGDWLAMKYIYHSFGLRQVSRLVQSPGLGDTGADVTGPASVSMVVQARSDGVCHGQIH